MKRWLKWLLWIGGIVIAIGGIALIALTMYLNKSKPKIDGETIVQVLDEEVIVTRDQEGVPHIEAQSDADLYRAQGYVQAQDRLFQMRSEERGVGKECRSR